MGIKDMRLPTISFLPNKSTATAKDTDNVFKTLNSVYFDSANDAISLSSDYDKDDNKAKSRDQDHDHDHDHVEQDHDHDDEDEDEDEDEDIESIIRGAHSESRLFFDPSTAKSIALDEDEGMMMNKYSPLKESVAMAMESEDPYMDFRVSMEEMVESNGMIKKDWGHLEELLAWYLRVNAKNNHAYIVAAFVDLLLKISSSPPNSDDLHQIEGSPSGCSTSTTSTRSSSCASGELQQLGLNSSSITSTSCFSPSASSSLSSHHTSSSTERTNYPKFDLN